MTGLYRHRFKLLLATLFAIILVTPVVFEALAETAPTTWRGIAMVATVCFLLTATLVTSGTRGARFLAYVLVPPSILVEAAALFFFPGELLLIHLGLRIVYVVFIIGAMLRDLFAPGQITFDTVCSSLCVYLLLGILWENIYAFMETVVPGSIITVQRTQVDALTPELGAEVMRIFRMRYFSFATLTSVGYGDVIPGTVMARMCAITEALLGQVYLLVMVSRLVGLHVSQTMPGSPPSDKS